MRLTLSRGKAGNDTPRSVLRYAFFKTGNHTTDGLSSLKRLCFKDMFIFVLGVCLCMHVLCTECVQCPQSKKASDLPELVTDGCELPCGDWEQNLGPL